MQKPIVECIPNFSEARRPEIIEQIIQSITKVPGVKLLDRHSDLDHNRTVLTFIGDPQGVENAAFNAIETASRLIDLDEHTGEHPRIGATDVVPFVPLRGITMEECVKMADRLGERVGRELSIPVYLYEDAAKRPDRKNLENIRRGEYEGLKKEISTNPDRAPDYGPLNVGKAGAVVIGARFPLIAFNVYLNTTEVSVAQKIAKAIRHSSGGFHYLKSLGMLVDGQAQVTMNLTDYRHTPLGRVVETIRREAQHYGAEITHSELVGLIPQEALNDAAVWYLQLGNYKPEQVLEHRLMDVIEEEAGNTDHLDWSAKFATDDPVPAGVSLAGQTAAASAALVGKVIRIMSLRMDIPDANHLQTDLVSYRAKLNELAVADETSYAELLESYRIPKNDPDRKARVYASTVKATNSPLAIAEAILDIFPIIAKVEAVAPRALRSDLSNARTLSKAASKSCVTAAETNMASLKGDLNGEGFRRRIAALCESLDSIK